MFREKQKIISHSINQSRQVIVIVCVKLKLDDDVGSLWKVQLPLLFYLMQEKNLAIYSLLKFKFHLPFNSWKRESSN